ncbi:Glutamyl-tRNA(Gln) amidotransferase subunit B, mitochondrial [Labeo rohita]|uniref:Glutamyl-tRNA(Gln) amidotransferase subunit B, mitochondrial n=1 Tax=Labeo rohita TaxID=84645 RepID=A0ABQ8KYN0_LABRO|nr:Glutamyl-tRNA(Gln) amidotransferase subunit B, mitochondrial [Labeo rohita]
MPFDERKERSDIVNNTSHLFTKKGKSSSPDEQADAIISTLSSLINTQSDALERMISANALRIEGLKKTIDFVCAEVQDLKKNVKDVDSSLKDQKHLMGTWVTHVYEEILSQVELEIVWSA